MLIATLPDITNMRMIEHICAHPFIRGVRYPVKVSSNRSPISTLRNLQLVTQRHSVKLWIDLKTRQPKVIQWATPSEGEAILLSHNIEVTLPAKAFFRNDPKPYQVVGVAGNRLFVDPLPPEKVGAGQSVNIVGEWHETDGFLTPNGIDYLKASKELEIDSFMVSFVRYSTDIDAIRAIYPESNLVLKIEDQLGLTLADRFSLNKYPNCNLMVAREDLGISLQKNRLGLMRATKMMQSRDPEAIVASHILKSLERQKVVSLQDLLDLRILQFMGVKHIMLGDDVSKYHFDTTMEVLTRFSKGGRLWCSQ